MTTRMDAKIILVFIGIINYGNCAGLLKTPKVYNAVITTDENLTPSRAFPVIQPTIHETGIATYPFGPFNPYRFYSPPLVHIAPPFIPQGLFPKEQYPVPQQPSRNVEPEYPEQRMLPPSDLEIQMPEPQQNLPQPQQSSPQQNNQEQQQPQSQTQPHDEKSPIPLNEFGLPPSLVPLQSQPQYENPITLQPYSHNNYPLIYEPSFQRFPNPYLPHYGYYPPPNTYGIRTLSKRPLKPSSSSSSLLPQNNKIPNNIAPPISNNESSSTKNNEINNNIKNGTENKNSEVPDVPPPPLPTNKKAQE